MSRKRSASSSTSSSSGSSSSASSSSSRVPFLPSGAPQFFIEWCKHADRRFVTQAQFDELLRHIKEIRNQLCRTEEVSRRATMAFFTNKVRKIYFDHATWENGERGRLEIEGLAELQRLHAGAQISKDAMTWIAGSLTAVLTTLRGSLRKQLTQLILHDFEQQSPRLSIVKYKALLAQDKEQRKKLVREGIRNIKEYLHDDNDRPATVTETHSARAFKFWYNWIRDGCAPGANSQDSCMFRLVEEKYNKNTTEDENDLDVGNTTFGEGSIETANQEEKDDDRRGFDFGEYSSEGSVERRSSLLCLDDGNSDNDSDNDSDSDSKDDGGGDDDKISFSSNDKNDEVYVDESQQGRATQVDIRKMIDDMKKNEETKKQEREAKKKEQEAKKKEQEAKKKEQEAKKQEREAKKQEREAKKKEQEAKKQEREAKKKEREAKTQEREAKKKEREEAKKEEQEAKKKKEEATEKEHNEERGKKSYDDNDDKEEEEEEKHQNANNEVVQGPAGKRIAKRSKSTDDRKKRKACNKNESSTQPAKKRKVITVTKPERTVTRSFAKKIAQSKVIPDRPTEQIAMDTQISGRACTVSLQALELANTFESVIEDTSSASLKRVTVPKEFHGQTHLRDELVKQLAAEGAEWGGNDDKALYILFSEDRVKPGGTTVYFGFA